MLLQLHLINLQDLNHDFLKLEMVLQNLMRKNQIYLILILDYLPYLQLIIQVYLYGKAFLQYAHPLMLHLLLHLLRK